MFKLAVLCVLVAAARANPQSIITPLGYSSNVVLPTVVARPTSIYSPFYTSPLAYSAPWGYSHLIKKRSAPLLSSYIAPTSYIAAAPYSYSAYATAPLAYGARFASYSSPVYATHLIKKRSAPFILPSTYVAHTTYASPYVSTYAAAPYVSAPLYPLAYRTHFIKKRSAPLAVTYTAPSFSHTSRFDFQARSPAVTYTSYAAPLAYASPLRYSHLY